MVKSLLLAGWVAVAAVAASAQSGGVEVEHAWARATPPNAKSAAIYMTLVNHGSASDRLLSVSTPAAGKAEVHETSNDNGIMRMRPVSGGLDVAPGKTTVLKPGGYHVMLTDLKAPLVVGQNVPVTLTFEKAGTVETSAEVEKAGSMGSQDMPGMKM